MTKRIGETIEVIEEILAHYSPNGSNDVRRLRINAVDTVAGSRGIRSKTVRDKFIRQLKPEIADAAQFDTAFEEWVESKTDTLKRALLGHTTDPTDRRMIAGLFTQKAVASREEDEKEQADFQSEIDARIARDGSYRAKLIDELRSLTPGASINVQYRGRRYRRDNKTVAQLKALRGYRCQVCGVAIVKRKGGLYTEAAHIRAKRLGGTELPQNIIILCPNHHKEFDFGNTTIFSQNGNLLEFAMNGHRYKVDLSLK